MKRYNILTAIHAIRSEKDTLTLQLKNEQARNDAKTLHRIDAIENLRRRIEDCDAAIEDFEQLLTVHLADIELVDRPRIPTIPVLSGETVQVIRDSLDTDVKSAESCYSFVKSALTAIPMGDSGANGRALREAEKIRDTIRRAKDEFNALYPIPEEKGADK